MPTLTYLRSSIARRLRHNAPRLTLAACAAALIGTLVLVSMVPVTEAMQSSVFAGPCRLSGGSGAPEGVVRGKVCDVYLRSNGAAGTVAYVKESGTNTATGWVAATTGVLASNIAKLDAANVFTAAQTFDSTIDINGLTIDLGNSNLTKLIQFRSAAATARAGIQADHTTLGDIRIFSEGGQPIRLAGVVTASDSISERGRTTAMGDWTSVTYNAANFTASAGTWTVDSADQVGYSYTLVGKTMTLRVDLRDTTVSGTAPSNLNVAIPGGFTSAGYSAVVYDLLDNGTLRLGFGRSTPSGSVIELYQQDRANWSLSTNLTNLAFTLSLEVQ